MNKKAKILLLSALSLGITLVGLVWISDGLKSDQVQIRFENSDSESIALSASVRSPANAISTKVAAVDPVVKDSDRDLAEIQTIKDCYTSGTCNFSQDDPKAYDFAVGRELQRLLLQFKAKYPTEMVALGKLAREFVVSEDGFVQEAAIKIFSEMPISPENLEALIEGLTGSPDPAIVDQGLQELKRYLGTTREGRVQEFLQETLAGGAHYSGEKASENILPFVNRNTIQGYQKTYASMSPNSKAARNLKTAIDEYLRFQGGG